MSTVPAHNLFASFPFGFLKRLPIPGIDVALGVTTYQIAGMARAATLAAVSGQRLTRRFVRSLDNGLASIWKDREKVKIHGVEIARQAARGALHAVNDTPLATEQLIIPVTTGIVKVTSRAGVNPLNGISGTSQGIIQGAVETGTDLHMVTTRTLEAARKAALEAGLSEEVAVSKATEGMLQAAEALGANTITQVKEALPVEVYGEENRKHEQGGEP
jgi:hypothetical protein